MPLKYPGLEPWEIWLSRGPGADGRRRRRPTGSTSSRARCARHGVELADLGAFTGDGRLVVRHGGDVVLDLDTDVPPRRPPAAADDGRRCRAPDRDADRPRTSTTRPPTLLALLAHRNIASKAATIHRYDHEIRGAHRRAPAGRRARRRPGRRRRARRPRRRRTASPIGIGVNPWYGLHDPEAMAYAVVDEAIRNVVAVGADPDRVALLDNFSWGDPRRPSTLGELVAAVDGLLSTRPIAYGAPFVSGKDSLNNEYTGADGQRHAVPPTLVITAVAHVPDADRCVTPELPTRRQRARCSLGSHRRRVRRQPPRPRARARRAAPGAVPAARPRRAGPLPPPAPRRSAPAWCRRATTSARAGWPWPSPRCASPAGSASTVDRAARTTTSPTALFAESPAGSSSRSRPADVDALRDADRRAGRIVLGIVTDDDRSVDSPASRPLAVDELVAAFDRVGTVA